jgi:hypothetical protein
VAKRRAKPTGVVVGVNEVVLEPFTKIMRFEKIAYEVQKVVMGGIAGFLYGDNKDQRDAFYKSSAATKNRTALLQLASQIHSYLDGTVSEFADIDDYVFRVLTRVRINTTDGRIIGDPSFEVDIFKHFGKVGAKGKQMKESLPVTLLYGTSDEVVWPKINKLLTRAVHEFQAIEYLPYKDALSAPAEMRAKAAKTPTLAIKEITFPVKLKIEEDGTNYFYIEDEGKEFRVEDDKDLVVFLTKKSGLRPEILGDATVFESVDKLEKEIRQISGRISEDSIVRPGEIDLIESLGIDSAIQSLDTSLAPLRKKEHSVEKAEELASIEKDVTSLQKDYKTTKVEYEVASEELENLEKKLAKHQITSDHYSVERWKAQTNKYTAKNQLVELQTIVKGELPARIAALSKNSITEGKKS